MACKKAYSPCRQARHWKRKGSVPGVFVVAINILIIRNSLCCDAATSVTSGSFGDEVLAFPSDAGRSERVRASHAVAGSANDSAKTSPRGSRRKVRHHDGSHYIDPVRLLRREAKKKHKSGTTIHQKDVSSGVGDISFFLRDDPPKQLTTLEGYWDIVEGLKNHSSRVFDESKARFSFCAMPDGSVANLASLPPRPPQRPYLLWGLDRSSRSLEDQEVLKKRLDMILVGYDLRPFGIDNAPLPLGITFAPPKFARSKPKDLSRPPRFFLTFRGDNKPGLFETSSVRRDLQRAVAATRLTDDVVIDIYGEGKHPKDDFSYEELFDTAYVIVPRGHGRWTYRFSETVGACDIPVVMADGLTLPYEELIDWSKAAVRLPESLAKENFDKILASLSRDPKVIRAMREEVCRINAKYFDTMPKRADAMLRSAAIKSEGIAREP
eukprot:TRINITY_DN44395_c0_g1_i1.p1 TRINITY_DN44395_c0_g1~~TRINITY_DN44395_c0_g1_i1.p1  ORF type:complete len:438 (+),score=67.51 TRINITY_DN44395_c0_g1_i1:189-1502(+)